MVCTENMFPLELYREQVWTPGYSHLTTILYLFTLTFISCKNSYLSSLIVHLYLLPFYSLHKLIWLIYTQYCVKWPSSVQYGLMNLVGGGGGGGLVNWGLLPLELLTHVTAWCNSVAYPYMYIFDSFFRFTQGSKCIYNHATVKAPVFGTLNSAISNFQTWFVNTVMEVLIYCWMQETSNMQCNYNSFIQIINFHGLFRNALRCRKIGACHLNTGALTVLLSVCLL